MSLSSTKKAVDKAIAKDMKKAQPKKPRAKKEKREAPEKQVEKEVTDWLKKQGFFFTIVESKLSTAHKRRGQRAVPPGFPDIVGVSPLGKAVYIELKAPARKNHVRLSQYEFLMSAMKCGAFAVHTWSVDDLVFKYQSYLAGQDLKQFMPAKFDRIDEPLFSDLFDEEGDSKDDDSADSSPDS